MPSIEFTNRTDPGARMTERVSTVHSMTSVAVLGNLSTEDGRQRVEEVAAAIRVRQHDAVVLAGSSLDVAVATAERAVSDGIDRLVAVGGDGVVNIAVNAVARSRTLLGVVPHGTGNDFARALGLLDGTRDDHVDRALAEATPIDAMLTNHGWVATVATFGFSGDVTARANALRWPRGQLRYTVATLAQLPRLRSLAVTIDVDGRPSEVETTLLAVGNTEYFGGGMRICPDARPDDGRFQVVCIGAVSRLRFLRVFPTVFSGRHIGKADVTTDSGSVMTIDGADVDLWADGERLGPLPVRIEVVPGAVNVAGALQSRRS